MKKPAPKPKPKNIRCLICHHWYPPDARGAFIEVGTGRHFCPECCSDILRVNGIKEDDFLPESLDNEPDILPIDEFVPEE
jgi:hypothetical protein